MENLYILFPIALLVAGLLVKERRVILIAVVLEIIFLLRLTGLPTEENIKHLGVSRDEQGSIVINDKRRSITIPPVTQ